MNRQEGGFDGLPGRGVDFAYGRDALLRRLSRFTDARKPYAVADLAVHPNTVRYQLNELRPFIDTHEGDGDRSAALLPAVRVHECLATSDTPGI